MAGLIFIGLVILIYVMLLHVSISTWEVDTSLVFVRKRIYIGPDACWTPFVKVWFRRHDIPDVNGEANVESYGRDLPHSAKHWWHIKK